MFELKSIGFRRSSLLVNTHLLTGSFNPSYTLGITKVSEYRIHWFNRWAQVHSVTLCMLWLLTFVSESVITRPLPDYHIHSLFITFSLNPTRSTTVCHGITRTVRAAVEDICMFLCDVSYAIFDRWDRLRKLREDITIHTLVWCEWKINEWSLRTCIVKTIWTNIWEIIICL